MSHQIKDIKKIIRRNTTLIRRARIARKLNKPQRLAVIQGQWKGNTERFKEAIETLIV